MRNYRVQHEHHLLQQYHDFLSIPNIASDVPNILRNAEWIMGYMRNSGITQVQLLTAETPNVPPAVYGEVMVPGATETIVLYAHYDGQPVDPSQWYEGLHPFRPQMANGSMVNGARIIDWPKKERPSILTGAYMAEERLMIKRVYLLSSPPLLH